MKWYHLAFLILAVPACSIKKEHSPAPHKTEPRSPQPENGGTPAPHGTTEEFPEDLQTGTGAGGMPVELSIIQGQAGYDKLLNEAKAACKGGAGASKPFFDDQTGECLCEPVTDQESGIQRFQYLQGAGQGCRVGERFIPMREWDEPEVCVGFDGHSQYEKVLEERPADFLSQCLTFRFKADRAAISFQLVEASNHEKAKELAKYLDANNEAFSWRLAPYHGSSFNTVILWGPANGKMSGELVAQTFQSTAYAPPAKNENDLAFGELFLYAETPADLEALRGVYNPAGPVIPTIPDNLKSDDPILMDVATVLQAYKNGSMNRANAQKLASASFPGGCMTACQLSQGFQISGVEGKSVWENVILAGGQTSSKEIVIGSEDQRTILAKIRLDAQGNVNLVMTARAQVQSGRLMSTLRMYNQRMSLLGQNITTLLEDPEYMRQVLSERKELQSGEIPVLMFESRFPLDDNELLPSLLVRNEAGYSATGWLPLQGDWDVAHMWSGITSFFGGALVGDNSAHGGEVAKTLLKDESGDGFKLRIMPIDKYDFAGSVANVDLARLKGAMPQLRVANVSFNHISDSSSCADLFAGRLKNQGIIFVAAAGNDGVERRDTDSTLPCPQGLSWDKGNVVTVGAASGSFLENYSDRGTTYVDIAAEGRSRNGTPGTSFAAPRVARALAGLASAHPNLSDTDLRMALLLGASHVSGLPVRSSGTLNRRQADRIAERIEALRAEGNELRFEATISERDAKTLLKATEFGNAEIDRKIQALKQNKLILTR